MSRRLLLLAVAAAATACSGGSTAPPSIAPSAVKAEQEQQRMMVLQNQLDGQLRLHRTAYRVLSASAPLCTARRAYRPSAVIVNHHSYGDDYQKAATQLWALGDTLQVVGLDEQGPAARAGAQVGDRIVAVNGTALKLGKEGVTQFNTMLKQAATAMPDSLVMGIVRDGEPRTLSIIPQELCDYGAGLMLTDEVNAYADGQNIYVTTGLLRFLQSDDELAVVVAHEVSHNAMGHVGKMKKNAIFGAILGALGDIAASAAGINTGGTFTELGAQMGAQKFSVEFEIEADYVGMYGVARAGYSLDAGPNLWRRFAITDPKAIKMTTTHPTTAERFVRLDATIAEIRGKQEAGVPLVPNPKAKPATT